jgi:orotate phosphoribosyltransferase-like protein
MSIASRNHTIEIDAKDIIKKAQEDKEIEAVLGLNENGVPVEIIAKSLKISKESVFQIIDNGQ